MKNKKAVVLLSGGLDSAVTLYKAISEGFNCNCLIFDYGQRHRREIESAQKLAKKAGAAYRVVRVSLPWKGSSLLDKQKKIPGVAKIQGHKRTSKIPGTYVPARNIIFLSLGLSYAEAIGAGAVFIGAHAQDYSGYPDCRPEFFKAFSGMARLGTKTGVEKKAIEIKTPLLKMGKAAIIKLGAELCVPFGLSWSCYRGASKPCGRCESCYYRAKGFKEAGLSDGYD